MATKKAVSTKKTSVKQSVATKVVSEPKVSKNKKMSLGDKAAALKPGALIAEFLGTFVLASVVINIAGGGILGSIAVAIVLAILVMVLGVVSGAHLNPAITIAQYANRKVDGVKASAYIASQILGAVMAMVVLSGIASANWDFNAAIEKALGSAGVTSQAIEEAGGLDKWSNKYGGIEAVASQLGVSNKAPETYKVSKLTLDKEWVALVTEFIGALVFGLGIGYAVYAKNKSSIETGLAVGVSLLAGLVIGGASVILNPAVAAAIGGFQWANPFGSEAMTFWWPVFTYIFATVIGMTAGFTAYRFILKDTQEK